MASRLQYVYARKTRMAAPASFSRWFGPASIPRSIERARTYAVANPDRTGGTPRIIPYLFPIGPSLHTAGMAEDLENYHLRLALDGLKPRQIIDVRPTVEFSS